MEPQPTYFDPNAQQQKQRKLITIIIAVLVVAVIFLILTALLGGGQNSGQLLGNVVARHNEIVRVLDEHADKARSAETASLVARARLIIASDARELTNSGIGPSAQPGLLIDNIDEILEDANRNNRFDEEIADFIDVMLSRNTNDINAAASERHQAVTDEILANYQALASQN